MSALDLSGKTALVTGAGRGLGKAISLSFLAHGANVGLFSLLKDELDALPPDLAGTKGAYLLHAGDASDESEAATAANVTMERFDRIDILVNNAGIIGPARFIEDTDSKRWLRTLDVNLNAGYHLCRAIIPSMIGQGGGRIINIVSGLGRMPFPRFSAYAVSKAGLIQLTRSLAEELKPFGIRVNGIDPGLMDTSLTEEIRAMDPRVLGEGLLRTMKGYQEQGALKDPALVAELALFLASDDSGDMTGQIGTLAHFRSLGWNPS